MSDQSGISGLEPGSGPKTTDDLVRLLYTELRRLAAQKLAREAPGQTLQATALVHEAWLRLGNSPDKLWDNERHFLGAAAEAMRRILVERIRRKKTLREGGQFQHLALDDLEIAAPVPDEVLLALDEALDELPEVDAVAAEVVKLQFFAGLTQEETARLLGVSRSTVVRAWVFARAWLFQQIRPEGQL